MVHEQLCPFCTPPLQSPLPHLPHLLFSFTLNLCYCFRLRLGGGNGMKWKGMKRIILEYSFLPLFGSFNEDNEKLILLFESLSGREQNGQEGTLISLYSLKISNFHSSRNWKEWEEMKLDLMIFLVKLPKYPYIFNLLF